MKLQSSCNCSFSEAEKDESQIVSISDITAEGELRQLFRTVRRKYQRLPNLVIAEWSPENLLTGCL